MVSCIAGIFSESTARGLVYHVALCSGFLETVRFCDIYYKHLENHVCQSIS